MTTAPKTALEGIRVLDLGRYQAGPRCGLVLARLGAEVIKVEPPKGEESRANGPKVRGQSAYWVQYNSGKKSLGLDLRKEQGKEVLRELVKVSDILIQNFRPGTIDEMGFGYDVLRSLNRKIVMVNVSAYGQYGPYRDRVGFDPIGQALSGHMSMTGDPDSPPTKTYFPLIDRITALHATIGALAAIRERELSGEGQCIDVCLADTGFTTMEIPIAAYLGAGIIPEKSGNGRGFSNTYRTTDGWVHIVAVGANMWPRVGKALDRPEWVDDPRFENRQQIEAHADVIEEEISRWFASRSTKESVELMSSLDIPIAPVNTVEQAAHDPQLFERELLVEVPDPIAGTIHVSGKSIKLSRSEIIVGSAPTPGQHTEEILTGILDYSPEQIKALRDDGVI